MNWNPGSPTACMNTWSVPPVLLATTASAPIAAERRQPLAQQRHRGGIALGIDAADLARAIVDVEIGLEIAVAGRGVTRIDACPRS